MAQRLPAALVTASDAEFSSVALRPVEGSGMVPADLLGHVFFVSPIGSVTSHGLPRTDGVPVMNGNGMVFRFDFDGSGTATVSSRIVKAPCYYADQVTSRLGVFKFHDVGLARMGLLGLRNELNTAFVTMCTPGQTPRLLVTWDVGRPYELDPLTLRTLSPVGSRREWKPAFGANTLFPFILTSAHPGFDENTGEFFGINYGRTVANIISDSFVPDALRRDVLLTPREYSSEDREKIESSSRRAAEALEQNENRRLDSGDVREALERVKAVLIETGHEVGPLERLLGAEGAHRREVAALSVLGEDFVRLVRWRGEGELEHFELVLPGGAPVRIEQSMHQLAITRHWIVLMDTGFRFDLETMFNTIVPRIESFERLVRLLLARQQRTTTPLYLVRRDQLVSGAGAIPVKAVTFEPETVHFLADYEDADDRITLYCHHNVATDVSEWLRPYDVNSLSRQAPDPRSLGLPALGQVDVNRIGRHIINANTGSVVESKILHSLEQTMGVGLYALRETLSTGRRPERLESIYWSGAGLWGELATQFVDRLYRHHPNTLLPFEGPDGFEALRQRGDIPGCLFRLDCATLTIADTYSFPTGRLMTSLQFAPRSGGSDRATDGYILATVAAQEESQLWIFDAARLAEGPLCKLSNPEHLKLGFTLHSAYLPRIAPRRAKYMIDARQELDSVLSGKWPGAKHLFEKLIYPLMEGRKFPFF